MVNVPTICRFGSHGCFGYRALEPQLGDHTDFLRSVVDLCGNGPLGCPASSPPLSPDRILPRLQPESLEPNDDTFINVGDYVDSDEDLAMVIIRIQQQEAANTSLTPPRVGYD